MVYLGKIPILTNIFQMGWNHPPVVHVHLHFLCMIRIFRSDMTLGKEEKNPQSRQVDRLWMRFRHFLAFRVGGILFEQCFRMKRNSLGGGFKIFLSFLTLPGEMIQFD